MEFSISALIIVLTFAIPTVGQSFSTAAGCEAITDPTPYIVNGVLNPQAYLDAFLQARVVTNVNIPPLNVTAGISFVGVIPNFYIFALKNIDEHSNSITIIGALEMMWKISPLGYYWANVPGLCNNLQYIIPYARSMTWTPKIAPSNMLNTNDFRDVMEVAPLEIEVADSTTKWRVYGKFELSCSLVLTDWPFDYQRCGIVVQQLAEFGYVQFYFPYLIGSCTSMYVPNGQWELVGTRQLVVPIDVGISVFKAEFVFRRKPLFNLLSLIIPTVLLSFSGAALFIIPADSGEKMGVAFSILLTFFLIFSTVVSSLPSNSENMPLFYTYILILFCTAVAAAITAAVILHFSCSIKMHEMEVQIDYVLDKTGLPKRSQIGKSARRSSVATVGAPQTNSLIPQMIPEERRSAVMNAFAPHEPGYPSSGQPEMTAKEREEAKKRSERNARITKYTFRANDIALAVYMTIVIVSTVYYFGSVVSNWNKTAPVYSTDAATNATFKMWGDTFFIPVKSTAHCAVCMLNATTSQVIPGVSCTLVE